jgi:hypothetical protein
MAAFRTILRFTLVPLNWWQAIRQSYSRHTACRLHGRWLACCASHCIITSQQQQLQLASMCITAAHVPQIHRACLHARFSRPDMHAFPKPVLQLRKDINSWVAKYRRDDKFSGKPSYR